VNLVSSNTSVATVPAFVNVPQGVSSFNISVTSVGAGSTTITATASGLPGATAAVTVTGGSAINLPVGLQVPMGPGALFPITLGSPAPPGGVTLTLTVGNPSRAAISPSSVYVPAGATTPNVQPTVSALNVGPNTITVAGSGYGTATANITGTATVQFVSGTTTTVRLGETGRLYMALGAAAPPGHTIAGRCEIVDSDFCSISVNLTAVTPGVVYVQPQFTYYPDGSNPPIGLVLFSPTAVGTTILKAGAPPYIPETTITVTVTN
jgi:hypothetical protein